VNTLMNLIFASSSTPHNLCKWNSVITFPFKKFVFPGREDYQEARHCLFHWCSHPRVSFRKIQLIDLCFPNDLRHETSQSPLYMYFLLQPLVRVPPIAASLTSSLATSGEEYRQGETSLKFHNTSRIPLVGWPLFPRSQP
jgi:hypothetical protein